MMEADICEGNGGTPPELSAVDWGYALKRVGGSQEALREVVQIFCDIECPKLTQTVRDAFADQDAVELTRAAHTLKNNADLFGAKRAFDAARTLEKLAGESNFEGAALTWAILEQELLKTQAAMANLDT